MRLYAFADEASASIAGQVDALRRNGLNGLEIRNVEGVNVSDLPIARAKELRARLNDAGLITWSIGSPIGKIRVTDDFGAHRDRFLHTLEVADALNAKNIRLFSFYPGEGNINFDRVFEKAEAGGTEFMLVEQDDCNGENPFDCLKRSYDYLTACGFR